MSIAIAEHTKGGLLEVSTIRATEEFVAHNSVEFMWVSVGKTVSRIRVPTTYRYHVQLQEDWKVMLHDKTFVVIAPPVRPSVPVAIRTDKLQTQSSGAWSVLTGVQDIAQLQRSITTELDRRADSPSYINFQREEARKTIQEFVAKWLITQERWKSASGYPIRVFFEDEQIGALKSLPQPLVGSF